MTCFFSYTRALTDESAFRAPMTMRTLHHCHVDKEGSDRAGIAYSYCSTFFRRCQGDFLKYPKKPLRRPLMSLFLEDAEGLRVDK